MNTAEMINLILQSCSLIFILVAIIFEFKLKKNDNDIFDIMKDHLHLIHISSEKIKILEKRIEELEKKNKKEKNSKTMLKNVSSK